MQISNLCRDFSLRFSHLIILYFNNCCILFIFLIKIMNLGMCREELSFKKKCLIEYTRIHGNNNPALLFHFPEKCFY